MQRVKLLKAAAHRINANTSICEAIQDQAKLWGIQDCYNFYFASDTFPELLLLQPRNPTKHSGYWMPLDEMHVDKRINLILFLIELIK